MSTTKALAVGIVIGIAIVGCIAAVTASEVGRYQVPQIWSYSNNGSMPVYDTQTGDVTWVNPNGSTVYAQWGPTAQ